MVVILTLIIVIKEIPFVKNQLMSSHFSVDDTEKTVIVCCSYKKKGGEGDIFPKVSYKFVPKTSKLVSSAREMKGQEIRVITIVMKSSLGLLFYALKMKSTKKVVIASQIFIDGASNQWCNMLLPRR